MRSLSQKQTRLLAPSSRVSEGVGCGEPPDMTLFTSYLGFMNRRDSFQILKENCSHNCVEFVYVMRNRGNNEVAPYDFHLKAFKLGEIDWDEYRRLYLKRIFTANAVRWMKEVGELAKKQEVVLVCYEKDAEHCHRTLLAQNVAKWSGCEYKGELR